MKFNERSFVRLLGDMRSYNFVFVVTPDFEEAQLRHPRDGLQSTELRRAEELLPAAVLQGQHAAGAVLHQAPAPETANQYRREEQTLLLQRASLASERLGLLLHDMAAEPIAPPEKVHLFARVAGRALSPPRLPALRVDGGVNPRKPGVESGATSGGRWCRNWCRSEAAGGAGGSFLIAREAAVRSRVPG